MKKIKIFCDECDKDISQTGSMPAYRLVLFAEKMPSNSDITYAAVVHNPIPEPMYFCNHTCLVNKINAYT